MNFTQNKRWVLVLLVLLPLISFSCQLQETEPDDTKTGQFSIEFDNIVGEETLGLSTRAYTNAMGEVFTIQTVQYFVSNIKLTNSSGEIYVVPQDESYFLINGSDRASRFTKVTVPEGDYT